jgi:hypothetical protein
MNVERTLPAPIAVCLAGATRWAGSELARFMHRGLDAVLDL